MKCCDIHSGKLSEPITFQRATLSSDGAGGQSQSWGTISGAPTRAWVMPLSGSEQYRFDRMEANVKLKLVVRYTSSIQEKDRVVIRSRNYNVRFINNIEFADKWLEVYVDGGVAT
jgi:SPP1 family predicted phage head-tail adaptor